MMVPMDERRQRPTVNGTTCGHERPNLRSGRLLVQRERVALGDGPKSPPVMRGIGYSVGMRPRLLAFVILAVLLQAPLLSQNCIEAGQSRTEMTAVSSPSDNPGDSAGCADCCSSCLCCHFNGVMALAGASMSLPVTGFLSRSSCPAELERFLSPFDWPPRA
jgi:hypothetical protein